MGERGPLFNGTMEDILLRRIASHSISQCYGVAAERGQHGWWRNGTLTLQTSQALRPRLCLQLTSSAHLFWPAVKSRVQRENEFYGVVMKPHTRDKLYGLNAKQRVFWERGVCKPCYLASICRRGKSVTTTLLRINLWRKLDVKCFFNTALKD